MGTYTYHATKKHQVASTSNGWSFAYDANGNMHTGRGSTIDWTSFNYPASIANGANTSTFSYTPDRQYWKQVSNYASGGAATTIYVGGLLEKVTTAAGTDYRHMIRAGSSTIVLSRQSSGTNSNTYVMSDHLGSSSAVTNGSGGVLVSSSFDAFGKRRGSNWSGSPSAGDWAAIAATTRRGYTEHTMLDNVGLIHMNGRVQDPVLGRFVSADPFITDPLSSQSYNRYSYTRNNPLTHIDPDGFNDCTVDPNAIQGTWFLSWEQITVNTYTNGVLTSSTTQNGSVTASFWASSVPLVCRPGTNPNPNPTTADGGGKESTGGEEPPQGQDPVQKPTQPCPGAVKQWVYDNVALKGEAQAAWGAGVVAEGQINLKEFTGAAGISGASFGADAHASANFSLYGPGLQNGFYGETQGCLHILVGLCLGVTHQNGHSNWELSVGAGAGASFSNALKYHKQLLPEAPYPGTKPGECTKKM